MGCCQYLVARPQRPFISVHFTPFIRYPVIHEESKRRRWTPEALVTVDQLKDQARCIRCWSIFWSYQVRWHSTRWALIITHSSHSVLTRLIITESKLALCPMSVLICRLALWNSYDFSFKPALFSSKPKESTVTQWTAMWSRYLPILITTDSCMFIQNAEFIESCSSSILVIFAHNNCNLSSLHKVLA